MAALTLMGCALAILCGSHCGSLAEAAGAPPPLPGELPPRVSAPALESPRAHAPRVDGEVREGSFEVVREPAQGAYLSLRDLPAAAGRARAKAVHVPATAGSGSGERGGSGDASRAAKRPTSPAVAPPAVHDLDAAGDPQGLFGGIGDPETPWFPPDIGVAVGPVHIVETVNAGFSVYTRFGTRVALGPDAVQYWDLEDFFRSNLPGNWQGVLFDPRVVYDSIRERFVMMVLGRDDSAQTSYAFVALSSTSDPTGEWCTRRITTTDTSGTSPAWLNFAGLGVDTWGLYLTGNAMYFSGGKRGAQIRSLNTDIYADCTQPLSIFKFSNVTWPDGAQADLIQPAEPHSVNASSISFFVSTFPNTGNQALLLKLTGDRGQAATLSKAAIDIPQYDAIDAHVDQPGSTVDLDGGASRVQNAVYANGKVFFVLTDDVFNDGTASGWLTVKLDTASNTEEWHHLLHSDAGIYYFAPALTLDGAGPDNNIAVFGSWTDAETIHTPQTVHPSGLFKIYQNQPVDATGPFVSTPTGNDVYVRLDQSGVNRWGDYSGAAYDWTCGHAWGGVEFAGGLNEWATEVMGRSFDDEGPCPILEVADPAPGADLPGGRNFTVRWLSDDLPATDEIYVYAFLDSGIVTIAEGLPSTTTSVNWAVPETTTQDALLSVGSWDGHAYTAVAWSQPFDITDANAPTPDPMSFATAPHALSTSEMNMTATLATDGSGGAVQYYFAASGGAGATSSGWIGTTAYTDAGLVPNTQYCYVVRARDAVPNTTGDSPQRCAYTLVANPVPAGFSNITGLSITVNWGTAGNPAYTEYHVQGQPGNLDSGTVTGSSVTFNGLTGGTSYVFQIRTRNQDGIETGWIDLGTASTLADDPDGDGVPAAADNCLNVDNPNQRDTDGDSIGNACDPDFNADCVVNFLDLATLKGQFFVPSPDPDVDLTGDGNVNFEDLGILKQMFFGPPGPSGLPNACAP